MKKTVSRGIFYVAIAAFLAACTIDPYTGEKKISKTAIGAITGAAIGAASSSKEDRKKGAAIGAVVGGSVGYYMDRQEAKLRAQLEGTGVSVTRDGDSIRLNMPGNITFDTNSSVIKAGFNDTLYSLVLVFKEFDNTAIKVIGHTDSQGSDAYNQKLSEQRANAIASYFLSQGISSGRVHALGMGERAPIASNDTEAGRAANRRVEIQIVPL